ncbi:Uncharacterised protein [Burkholderia pseudomallei]|nr:Uncharacterised protein [Burkholderia pseudomallei]
MPASTIGVTSEPTHGIANAFASGPASGICANQSTVSGASAIVTANCARAASRTRRASRPNARAAHPHANPHAARHRARCDGGAPSCPTPPSAWRAPRVSSRSRGARHPDDTARIAATAQNDSQNPADVTAHGSTSSTQPSAAASTDEGASERALRYATPAAASIHHARCTGTLKPASAA